MTIVRLVVSIIICEGAGLIGTIFTTPSIRTWFVTIRKPAWQPPDWLFGPVWTLLFLLMGIALFLVWNRASAPTATPGPGSAAIRTAFVVFAIQLVLNILWSVLFFG